MKISVLVVPRSSQAEVIGKMADGTLKVKLTAPPVDGAANKQLVEILAAYFDVKKSAVDIVRGESSKRKVVAISL